jgi:hypothetical protein
MRLEWEGAGEEPQRVGGSRLGGTGAEREKARGGWTRTENSRQELGWSWKERAAAIWGEQVQSWNDFEAAGSSSRRELGQSWKAGLGAGIGKAGAGEKEVACGWSGRELEPGRYKSILEGEKNLGIGRWGGVQD